jgi:hypothetical protein
VKVTQFNELCESQWANGRGEVTELNLREDSFDELYKEIFVDRVTSVSVVYPHWDLVNPMTRGLVKVKTVKDADSATVYYGPWKTPVKINV